MIVWRRHLKLQNDYWREQQRTVEFAHRLTAPELPAVNPSIDRHPLARPDAHFTVNVCGNYLPQVLQSAHLLLSSSPMAPRSELQ